jgi:hypothetical protein
MKIAVSLKRHSLPVLALPLALLPVFCSCTNPNLAINIQDHALMQAYRSYIHRDYMGALREIHIAESVGELSYWRQADASLLMGRCLEGMGHRLEAASQYEYVIKTYPDTQYAACASGRLEELRNQPQIPNRP